VHASAPAAEDGCCCCQHHQLWLATNLKEVQCQNLPTSAIHPLRELRGGSERQGAT
jgi:hypothetical protein